MATINGTSNADLLIGTVFDDLILGLGGDDVLDGGAGNDILQGGNGDDTYFVDSAGDLIIELSGNDVDTVHSTVSWTLGADLENLVLEGASDIDGTGNTSHNTLTGNSGSNTLSGEAGNDLLEGQAGADVLLGGAGSDFLHGGSGNDVLDGGTGPDRLFGGAGDDTYVINDNGDLIIEFFGAGADTVQSHVNSYTLYLQIENLELLGSARNGAGNAVANTITGNTQNNHLEGKGGADKLYGGTGNDRLQGDEGNDTLDGDSGNDTLIGGDGSDIFVFNDTLNASNNGDKISDFAGAGATALDLIYLDNDIFTALAATGNLAAENFFVMGGGTQDVNDYILYNTSTGQLFYDADGNGGADALEFAMLAGSPDTLDASDFVVV